MQVCLNGTRTREECAHVPWTATELAAAAVSAVAAGADEIHLHPKTPDGADTLAADHVAGALTAVRKAVPGIAIGVAVGALPASDAAQSAAAVRSWTVVPDSATVTWQEDGADLIAAALQERGVRIEAAVRSAGDARRYLARPRAVDVARLVVEITDADPRTAPAAAVALLTTLAGPASPVLMHGRSAAAWSVLHMAAIRGMATRIGLQDVLELPDGTPATNNAELITHACRMITHASAGAPVPHRGAGSAHRGQRRIRSSVLRAGFAQSKLTVESLWLRYVGVGGAMPFERLHAALHAHDLPELEHDLIAQALNEYFLERGTPHPVAYADEVDDHRT
ncbi:3-keto-5-aminohexanoate cleavage protein [Pseudonocardia sp. GCM10023141]|uniref:3-keto-5-aminohexanoate cleavage protein n=1 Tax=Pseudonocardia sp. GCM10023141 TaxID=3252653 RepID=UPI00361A0A40